MPAFFYFFIGLSLPLYLLLFFFRPISSRRSFRLFSRLPVPLLIVFTLPSWYGILVSLNIVHALLLLLLSLRNTSFHL